MPGPHQYYSDETRGHKTWQNNIVHQQDMIGKCQMLRDGRTYRNAAMGVVNTKQKVYILYLYLDPSAQHQGWRLVTILTMHGEAVAEVIDNMYT